MLKLLNWGTGRLILTYRGKTRCGQNSEMTCRVINDDDEYQHKYDAVS